MFRLPDAGKIADSVRWPALRTALAAFLCLYVFASVLLAAALVQRGWFEGGRLAARSAAAANADIDLSTIIASNSAKPTFLSTFDWWISAWSGTRIYWRPLASQLFWLEQRAFGPGRFDLWYGAELASHLLATALLGWLAWLMTGRRSVAVLAVFLFAAWRPLGPDDLFHLSVLATPLYDFNTPAFVALLSWKDSVDVWITGCLLCSLICVENKRWWGSLLFCCAAAAIKESGTLTFAITGAYVFCRGQIKETPSWVYAAVATAILAIVGMRFLAQHLSGEQLFIPVRDHANRSWPFRLLSAIDGSFGDALFSIQWPDAVLGAALGVLIARGPRSFVWWTASLVAAILGTISLCALITSTQWGVMGETMLDPACQLSVTVSALVFVAAFLLAARSVQVGGQLVTSYVLIVLTALPTATILQPNMHMFYGIYAFESLFVAVLSVGAWDQLLSLAHKLVQRQAISTSSEV